MSTFGNSNRGFSGSGYDRAVERLDESTLSKLQQQYWEAKQIYLKNIKRKEDDCIVASDSELDAKLEDTCSMLLWTLERFQDRIWVLAHEESSMGRFLREAGKVDKTRAGVMLTASGKTMSFIANQRILLRHPLVRLYQDIETFQYRAVTDTYETIDKMETSRTAYRAALLWMKDISSKLDPDTYKQLEKFRKVQSHVRRSKSRFEKIKIDTYQKIDMLSASRVNMFSHSLGLYQKEWLSFYEKSSKIMNEINEAFAGYQYYDFNILKQLTEPQKKAIHSGGIINSDLERKLNAILEGDSASKKNPSPSQPPTSIDDDKLLLFDPSGDSLSNNSKRSKPSLVQGTNLVELISSEPTMLADLLADVDDLVGSIAEVPKEQSTGVPKKKPGKSQKKEVGKKGTEKSEDGGLGSLSSNLQDLLTSAEPDERELLSQIFSGPIIEASPRPIVQGNYLTDDLSSLGAVGDPHDPSSFLPSQLLEEAFSHSSTSSSTAPQDLLSSDPSIESVSHLLQSLKLPHKAQNQGMSQRKKEEQPMEKWLNLFAELDPLANPDAIGKQSSEAEDDRTC